MSAPNSKSDQLLDPISELIKCAEQIQGKDSGANSPTVPLATSASTSRVPAEKDKKLKVKRKKKEEGGDQSNKQKFSTSLSVEEIDHDVFLLTGKRPLRSKLKRDDKVKKDLDNLYYCSSLEGHDADSLRKSYGF